MASINSSTEGGINSLGSLTSTTTSVEGKTPAPPEEIDNPKDPSKKSINPTFDHCYQLDQLVLSWIISSRTGRKPKVLLTNLSAVSGPVSQQDLVMCILSGLRSEYESIITAIANRPDFDKLRISNQSQQLRNNSQRGRVRGRRGNQSDGSGRGRGRGNTIVCQLCNIPGHGVWKCQRRFDISYLGGDRQPAQNPTPDPIAFHTGSSPQFNRTWYLDSRATHHITSNLDNLQIQSDYCGFDQVKIGNGTGLEIKNIGSSIISHNDHKFYLEDIYHVPSITKNLFFVSKFTKDNNVVFEFHPSHFLLKDHMGRVLLYGPSKGGLYQFPASASITFAPPSGSIAFISEEA
ncbi:PREDICTED: uncharacterized protein LOC104602215 [Nelumbo nucifera]|uniref:Uncharacterized protein LOC104602215 n=1 Tax=Nelumbo nucifera TaxID=4432 RepID=A0A1U8ANP5_NELNU|nr:PREDICTED: uncharacterized protein LOC104602215 [Nelumbo nucifera]